MNKFIFSFVVTVIFTNLFFGQTRQDDCSIKSTFEKINDKVYYEDQKMSVLDLIDNFKDKIQSQEHPRSVIVQFFFDETNKFNKTVEDFRNFLKDSLSSPTDLKIIYKFQKTRGSAFINNGSDQISVVHLNALVYSKDPLILKELFGKGKNSRIDTTSTKLKNFTHEFLAFDKVSDEDQGYLFLYRGKLIGKGFACDPDEDIDILGTFKNIYKKKYVTDCQNKKEEEEKQQTQQKLDTLQKRNDSLELNLAELNKKISQSNKPFTIFSQVDILTGTSSSNSSYFNDLLKFSTIGLSTSTGVLYIDEKFKGFYFSGALNIGSCVYDVVHDADYEFISSNEYYNSIVKINNFKEQINSKFVSVPLGIGYQYKNKNWPVFFQLSLNGILGFNKFNSSGSSGFISYRRYYSDLGILVTDQPQHGLRENIQFNVNPTLNEKIALLFGTRIETKILYDFGNSPISGFMNLGLSFAKTNVSSNGSTFISESYNNFNSIFNSVKNVGFSPLNIGFGISYELRKKIKI